MSFLPFQKKQKMNGQILVKLAPVNVTMMTMADVDIARKIATTNAADLKRMLTRKTDRRRRDTEITGTMTKVTRVDGDQTGGEIRVIEKETGHLDHLVMMIVTKGGEALVKIDIMVGTETMIVKKFDQADMINVVIGMINLTRKIVIVMVGIKIEGKITVMAMTVHLVFMTVHQTKITTGNCFFRSTVKLF